MGKPDDITQDAWDEGLSEARFYADWLHAGNSTGQVSEHAVLALADSFARTIIAAKALGYREVADMADAYADVEDVSAIHAATDESNHYHRVAETTLRAFSTAVRARGEAA